jgi:hypothetical protein
VITESGGEVIQTEGDSITFFFDQLEADGSALSKTIASVRELDMRLRSHLSDHDHDAKDSPKLPGDIRLRAALDIGTIRPVWQRFEGRDVPSWEQTADSNVFVDIARLMEAEAKVGNQAESALIFKHELSKELSGTFGNFTAYPLVEIKHGRKLNVAISSLGNVGFQVETDVA